MKKPLLLILMSLFTFGLTVKAQDEGKRIPFQGSYYENGEPFNGNKTFTFTESMLVQAQDTVRDQI